MLLLTILYYRYKRAEDAKMALEQMEGFELAGRTVSFLCKIEVDKELTGICLTLATCEYCT